MHLPRRKYSKFRDTAILLITPFVECYKYSEIYGKELIHCLVLLLLTAVLYRIYHGFLTAEKRTLRFSHSKDCTGSFCYRMWPDVTSLYSEEVPHLMRHLKLIKGQWLELKWCSPCRMFCLPTDQSPRNNCKYQRVHGSTPSQSYSTGNHIHGQHLWRIKEFLQGYEWLLSGSWWLCCELQRAVNPM